MGWERLSITTSRGGGAGITHPDTRRSHDGTQASVGSHFIVNIVPKDEETNEDQAFLLNPL